MARILPILVLALLAASCASLQRLMLKEPTVAYSKVQVKGIDFDGIDLLVDFNVTNPNRLDLQTTTYDWTMSIGGREFASGRSSTPVSVPGKTSALVQIPVSLGFKDLFAAFGELLTNDSIPYIVKLNAALDVPVLGQRMIPVETKGHIPVPKLPRFRVDDFELTKFSLAGSTVTLKVRIENPNYFGVSMSNVAYALKINNDEWLNTRLNRAVTLLPKSDIVMDIPIEVNMQRWGTTVYRILTRGEEFSYNLQGKGDLRVALPEFADVVPLPFAVTGKRKIQP
jgi:LEA14-like dessication related protein